MQIVLPMVSAFMLLGAAVFVIESPSYRLHLAASAIVHRFFTTLETHSGRGSMPLLSRGQFPRSCWVYRSFVC